MANNHGGKGQSRDSSRDKQPRSQGGFGMFPHWTQNVISGMFFGGVAVDKGGKVGKTYIIGDGRVWTTQEDVKSPGFADSYTGGHDQAYKDIATQLSNAAGKIYIEMCRCRDLPAYDTSRIEHSRFEMVQNHPEVRMSGFWIQGSRFVTSAHFLDVLNLSDKEKQNTETYLKAKASASPQCRDKAIVSSDPRVAASGRNASRAVNVYLLKLDRDSDVAIFQAYDDDDRRSNPIPHGLLQSQLATMTQCDLSQGAYTIGYYSNDSPLSTLTSFDKQTLNTFWPADDGTRPRTYFQLKCAGVTQKRDNSIQFEDVFGYPDHRTISTGTLEKALSTQKLSTFVFCQISTWFQSSGGMVGGFVQRQVNGRKELVPVVLGIFRGEEGPTNVIAAFSAAGIKWLFS